MTHPKLSMPSSGMGGRGYRTIFEGDGKGVVPSVTTALGAIEKPGLVNWHVENTVAYCVQNIDELLSRTEEQGMGYMRYYTRRLKPEQLDDEELTAYNYSMGVLDDLSELGNFIHDYIEADLNGWFDVPEPWREDQAEMVLAYHEWRDEHDVEVVCTEQTVFGDGYAGTLDSILIIDGVPTLVDVKSSRTVYESHVAQLAALGATHSMAFEVPKGTEGAVHHKITPSVSKFHDDQVDSWWLEKPVPAFEEYAVLQVRPNDYDRDGNFIPAFAQLHRIPQKQIDAGFDLFQGGLAVRAAQRKYKAACK